MIEGVPRFFYGDPGEVDGDCAPGVWGPWGGGVDGGERKGSGVPGGETSRWRVRMRVSMRVKSLSEDLADLEDMGVCGVVGGVNTVVGSVVKVLVSVGVVLCELGAGDERDGWIVPKRLRTVSKHCLRARGVGAATGLGASGGVVEGVVGSEATGLVGRVVCGMGGAGAWHGTSSGEGKGSEVRCGRATMGL